MSEIALKRILLVVDDKEDVAEALRFTLQDSGYEVVLVAGIEEAMEKASEEKFHATVLDVPMNQLSRLEVAKKLKADALTALPIIVLTDDEEQIVRKQFTGYDGFVSADADLSKLVKQVALLTAQGANTELPPS